MRDTSIVESIHHLERRWNFDLAPTRRAGARGFGSAGSMRGLFALLAVTSGLLGCAVHPLVDDVSPIPTEAIVAAARCELRLGLVHQVEVWFADLRPIPVTGIDPNTIAEPKHMQEMQSRFGGKGRDDLSDWPAYMNISIAYDWTFDITETNHADAGFDFKLPFMSAGPGSFDLTGAGSVTAVREGKRTFKTQDKFADLLTTEWYNFCNDIDRSIEHFPNTVDDRPPFAPRQQNLLYPITGSIGLARAVKSFLKVAVEGGALDTFTDELTFTTTFDGKLGSTVVLSPVPNRFRLVNATANAEGTRVDMHKVKISMAFPKDPPKTAQQLAKELFKDPEYARGLRLNTAWRARYALCVVDARSREDEFKLLRLDPPEVTCLASTDAFFSRGDGVNTSYRTGSRYELQLERASNPPGPVLGPGAVGPAPPAGPRGSKQY